MTDNLHDTKRETMLEVTADGADSLTGICQRIDKMIQGGYAKIEEQKCTTGCDDWLLAWEDLKSACKAENCTVFDLEERFEFTQFLSNFVQDLEMELCNAGNSNRDYHFRRIDYCKELLEHNPKDILMLENTRRALAESYFESGNADESDRLFEEWLRGDPDWGWGYIGWSDNYWLGRFSVKQYDHAAEIIERGLSNKNLRDRLDLLDRACDFYEETENEERLIEIKREFEEVKEQEKQKELIKNEERLKKISRLHDEMAKQETGKEFIVQRARSEKVGRNALCPCGSGKKYKRCCLE